MRGQQSLEFVGFAELNSHHPTGVININNQGLDYLTLKHPAFQECVNLNNCPADRARKVGGDFKPFDSHEGILLVQFTPQYDVRYLEWFPENLLQYGRNSDYHDVSCYRLDP